MRNKLKEFRGKYSQKEMAEKYNVSQQAWSKWEKGVTCPSPAIMLMLSKDSGFSIEELFFNISSQQYVVDANLKSKREAANLSVEEISKILNISEEEYAAIENGTKVPSDSLQASISMIFS
jgi:DNA-binding XRE family transcriptional regulator